MTAQMNLKNKRILITAGPTWVAIDKVRVISNTASGETGILLAKKFASLGAKVTLLLGPVGACCLGPGIRLINFRFFAELEKILKKELSGRAYHTVIHSAAVSDYQPQSRRQIKIKSGIKDLCIRLKPTEKLINLIKKIDPGIFAVGFKFEPQAGKAELIRRARQLLSSSQVDLVLANTCSKRGYQAYLVDRQGVSGALNHKTKAAQRIIKAVEKINF